MQDGLQNFQIRWAREWALASQELIKNYPERENITAPIERGARGLLRRHVGDGADYCSGPCEVLRHRSGYGLGRRPILELRQPEVGQLGISILRNQNIVGFHVAVGDASRVRTGKAIGDSYQEFYNLPPAGLGMIVPLP
jgi:hypothetical protein